MGKISNFTQSKIIEIENLNSCRTTTCIFFTFEEIHGEMISRLQTKAISSDTFSNQ